jgi:hypothetical protein
MNNPTPSHNYVPEYQQSSIPFVTSSADGEVTSTPIKVEFPYVTRWVQVFNIDSAGDGLRVGFTSNGVNATATANYLLLTGSASTQRLEVKCKELWFRRNGSNNTSFSVIAGLTSIPANSFPVLSSSNQVLGVG